MNRTTFRTSAIIEDHGWAVIKVPEDAEGPGFAYSVGPYHSFGHPEIILFGLTADLMHQIVNILGELIRSGNEFRAGSTSSDVLEGFEVGKEFRQLQPLLADIRSSGRT